MLTRARVAYARQPLLGVALIFTILAVCRIAGAFNSVLMVVSVAFTPLALLIVPRQSWHECGVCWARGWRPMAFGLGVVVAAYLATALACQLAFGSGRDNWIVLMPDLFRGLVPGSAVGAAIAMIVCMGVLVPLCEELFYRGLLHQTLVGRLGAGLTVLATSTGWALVHLGDYGLHPLSWTVLAGMLPSVFVMGLALGACRVATGSAFGCVVAQGAANLLLVGWAVSL
jgi:membrane protease YdiL (CAAX protease family)